MAEAWIKWTKGLHRKREVLGVAARLGFTPAHAAGLCMIFWEWLDDNVSDKTMDENGNARVTLGALPPVFVDNLVGTSGFAAALTAEDWLCCRSGSLVVPNYGRHNGQTAKERALTGARVHRHREKKGNGGGVTGVTAGALPDKRREEESSVPLGAGAEVGEREVERDGPNRPDKPDKPHGPAPAWMGVGLAAKWALWLAHLREMEVRPTGGTLRAWEMGLQRACPRPGEQGEAERIIEFSLGKRAKSLLFGGEIVRNGERRREEAARPTTTPKPPRQAENNKSTLFPDGPPPGVQAAW